MLYPYVPVLPLVLALGALALLALWRAIISPAHRQQRLLEQRARWAEAHGFIPVHREGAAQQLVAAMPGLRRSGEQLEILDAFEKQGCLIAGVAVGVPSRVDLRIGSADSQRMTVARTFIQPALPPVEVRPWVSWPPDARVVAHRRLGVQAGDGSMIGHGLTVVTRDDAFDKMFVVRASDSHAALELLTARVRNILRKCPGTTFSFAPGAIIACEPQLLGERALDCLASALTELHEALLPPPYAARATASAPARWSASA